MTAVQDCLRLLSEANLDATELAALRRIEEQLEAARQDYLNERGHHAITNRALEEAEAQVDTLQRLADRAVEQLEAHQAFLAHVSDWRLDKAIELVRSDLPIEGVMRERLLGRLLNIRDHAEQFRDHEIRLVDGRTLFEHLHEWRNAPSNTASADPYPARRPS